MSKKTVNKKNHKQPEPRKRPVKAIVIAAVVITVLAAAGAAFGIFMYQSTKDLRSITDCVWVPLRANDASGDEVPMEQVYQVKYSNYRGSMKFRNDGIFELWMTPGEPSDGTHTGTYKLSDDAVEVTFDEGTQTRFLLHREGGLIDGITVAYEDYEVFFVRESTD